MKTEEYKISENAKETVYSYFTNSLKKELVQEIIVITKNIRNKWQMKLLAK